MQTTTNARRDPRPAIRPRKLDLDLDPANIPLAWWDDDLFLSLFGHSLSLVFPVGEKFFVDSVRRYRKRITDPSLLADINGFAGQETLHGKAHDAFNAFAIAHGLDNAPAKEAHVARLLDRVRKLPPIVQLAVTCALEHFTATLAEQVLDLCREIDDMHPAIRPMWLWHALEESEHKAVAFDVYEEVGGGYAIRAAVMVAATIVFVAEMAHLQASFAHKKGLLSKPWRWGHALSYMWISPGVFTRMIPGYLDYFRPGFHPNDRDTTGLVDEWRARMFATPAV